MLGTYDDCSDNRVLPGEYEAGEWPVPCVYLDALRDLGLSNEQIGRYFHVAAAEVEATLECRCN